MASVTESERETVALLRRREPQGFERCYALYRDAVFGFLVRLSGRRSVAEDLFQETWLRVARRAAELRPDSDLRAWLFTIARNAFRSYLRAQRAELGEAELEAIEGPADTARGVELSELERALLCLSLEERELLLLVAEGIAQDELARAWGLAAPALRQRVTRARARLAEVLDAEPVSASRKRSNHG